MLRSSLCIQVQGVYCLCVVFTFVCMYLPLSGPGPNLFSTLLNQKLIIFLSQIKKRLAKYSLR